MSALQELQNYTFVSKYARWLEDKNRRETWKEAVERVKNMMHTMYADKNISEDINWAYDMMYKKKVLGSQRCLQFGGEPILKRNSKLYNCTASYCDRLRFFQECFWLLLCGSGTGFSVQKHHVAKLPSLEHNVPADQGTVYLIEDSIEGWADALGALLSSYFSKPVEGFEKYKNCHILFDYSEIRPQGSPLSSGVGKAPGFEPLAKGLEKIRALLDRCVASGQKKLRPIDAYDIVMHSSDAVLSGGVRRSASLALFSPDDEEMAKAKTGNWYIENPQRARSNNSALLLKDQTKLEDFKALMESVKEFGEPGFIWGDSTEMVFNPCVVANSTVVTDRGVKMVSELINKSFNAIVDGVSYPSYKGFWHTGKKQVIELEFKSGRTLRVTPNHKIMTTIGWKEAGDINFGERVVINNHRSYNLLDSILNFESNDWKRGYLLGLFLGDGNHNKGSAELRWWGESKEEYRKQAYLMLDEIGYTNNHHNSEQNSVAVYSSIRSKTLMDFALEKDCMVGTSKRLSKESVCGSWNHISGLIAGYFDADGTVLVNNVKGSSLRISSVQLENLQNLQIGLNALGIYSKIYKNRRLEGERAMPDGKGGTKNYFCQTSHELVISSENIVRFAKYIPIRNEQKIEKLNTIISNYKRMPNRTNFIDTLVNKTIVGDLDVYDCTVEEIHAFDNDAVYVHNCVEISMWPVNEKNGESGWQGCNLSTINCSSIEDEEDFYDRCKVAAIIGTLQAGFTKLEYLGKNSEEIFEREALLGVSMTGIMEKHELILTEKVLKAGAKIAVETNKELAKKIGINQAARVTCLKPEGCLAKDTTIVSNHGILSLEEIGDIYGDKWQELDDTNIATDKVDQKASKFFINGYKPTKKILTSGGIELEATLNHKFRIITIEGKYEWKTSEELSVGDILPYKIGTYNGGNDQELYVPDIQRSKYASRLNTNINLPTKLDENFAWFLGLYTGDGSNHPNKYSIRIHGDINKKQHLIKAQNYINSLGIDAKIIKYNQDSKDVRCALYITSRLFYEFLQHNALLKNKSCGISIPLSVRKSKSHIISAFIDGYGSADGCTKGHTRSFCTTSKLMATQLVQCLRAIGLDCKTRLMPPTPTSYGSSMRYWIQERLGRNSDNVAKSQYNKYYKILDGLGLHSFGVDFIVDIQDSSSDTYDLSVDHEDHTYLANSYVSHNTSSSMLGTSSGIHPHHAKRYIRHVQANILEAPYQHFKSYNPQACEKSSWSANNTDEVVKFPIEVPDGSKLKNQLPAVDMLKIVKETQKNWVHSGKNRSLCTQEYLCHNVSNTVTVKPDEWDDVTKYIYDNRKYFAGISLIPQSGDKDYPQAPFTTVYTSREIVKEYGDAALWCSGLIELALNAFDNNLWAACDYVSMNQGKTDDTQDKLLFVTKMKNFAGKYFDGDIRRLTYCMKDVYNWKIYCDLFNSFKKVDYTQLSETEDNTMGIEEISCAGGACLI